MVARISQMNLKLQQGNSFCWQIKQHRPFDVAETCIISICYHCIIAAAGAMRHKQVAVLIISHKRCPLGLRASARNGRERNLR